MAKITITIPDNKVARVTQGIIGLNPVPQVKDPDNEGQMINAFTDSAWVKAVIVSYIKNQVIRYERKVALDQVNSAINASDIDIT